MSQVTRLHRHAWDLELSRLPREAPEESEMKMTQKITPGSIQAIALAIAIGATAAGETSGREPNRTGVGGSSRGEAAPWRTNGAPARLRSTTPTLTPS